jgi:hypothetical protein
LRNYFFFAVDEGWRGRVWMQFVNHSHRMPFVYLAFCLNNYELACFGFFRSFLIFCDINILTDIRVFAQIINHAISPNLICNLIILLSHQVQLDCASCFTKSGLDTALSDSGSNLSSGESQLVCLARGAIIPILRIYVSLLEQTTES